MLEGIEVKLDTNYFDNVAEYKYYDMDDVIKSAFDTYKVNN